MIFAQKVRCRTHAFLPSATSVENILQISIQRQIAGRRLLTQHGFVKISDRGVHLFYSDVGSSAGAYRVKTAKLSESAIHVAQLFKRGPPFIFLPPARAGREPYGKSFGKVFIRMLLRVPAFHVADKAA